MNRQLRQNILVLTGLIMAIGLAALYSASFQNVRVANDIFYDQLFCAVSGLALMVIIGRMDYRKFFEIAYIFYAVNMIFLLIVFFAGRYALGAKRWMDLGFLSFQPSEMTKLAVILLLARYFSDRKPSLSFTLEGQIYSLFRELLFPFFWTVLPAALIFKQPDLGTALLVMGIFGAALFASGIDYKRFLGFGVVILGIIPLGWHFLKQYQKDRLLVFLNPNIDPLGAGYTIIQSKIAIGSGGIWGKGWLSGTQNQLNFLPERHTDFIFSVIGEEWGLMGAFLLLLCFFFLIKCGLTIAEQLKDRFGMLVAVGIVAILTLQVTINIGMALGLCPVVGITLPFVSYGRTSYLTFAIMIGFLISLSRRRTIF